MEIHKIEQLEEKLRVLFDYEKEIAKELKQNKSDTSDLKLEIEKINKKIDEVTHQLDKLMNGDSLIIKKKKHYTDEEIYSVRMKTSLSKAAAILCCSKSTVQRACSRYTNKIFKDMEV